MDDATIIDFTGRDAVTDPLTDLLLCSPSLDRRALEFSGSFTMTGWLRHRDNAALSGRCIRLRYGDDPRCSVYAKSPTLRANLQGS